MNVQCMFMILSFSLFWCFFFPSIHLYIYDAFSCLQSSLSLSSFFLLYLHSFCLLSIHSFCLFSGLDAKRQVYFVVTGGIRWKKLVRLDSCWYFNRWSILILFLLHLLTEERTVFERRQEMEYERERERGREGERKRGKKTTKRDCNIIPLEFKRA